MENNTFDSIRDAIQSADRIAVVSHDRPDGDAIGSTLALTLFLVGLGKNAIAVNCDLVPDSLKFLPGIDSIRKPGSLAPIEADVVIAVDAAGKNRIGDAMWDSVPVCKTLINIDHHISNDHYADLNYVDAESPATGEIMFQLIEHISGKSAVTPAIAANLYAAISTDTGSFCYPNTTAKTYRIGAELIEAGANVGQLNQQLYESYPQRRVELLRELLQKMEIHFEGRFACLQLTLEAVNRLGIQSGDTEGLIDIIRAIDTVIVAVFFEEMPDGKIRVSSRSKTSAADVGKICAGFGGGGHTLAAGTRMSGPIGDAKSRFLAAVEEVLEFEL